MNERALKEATAKAMTTHAQRALDQGAVRPKVGHVLKCWPGQFEDIVQGDKPFTVRKDDRDFKTGDTVVLVEYDPETKQHTGRSTTRTIGYLGRGIPYPAGYCAFMLTYGEGLCTAGPVSRVR